MEGYGGLVLYGFYYFHNTWEVRTNVACIPCDNAGVCVCSGGLCGFVWVCLGG